METGPSTRHLRAALAWGAWGLTLVSLAALVPLYVIVSARIADPASGIPDDLVALYTIPAAGHVASVFEVAAVVAFVTLGALIVQRQPGNRVGWLFCAIGALYAIEWLTALYAIASYVTQEVPLPGALAVAWVNNWVWVPSAALMIAVLPLVYPDGRLPSRRWRPVAWLAWAGISLTVVIAALHSGPLFNAIEPVEVANPIGVGWIDAERAITVVPFLMLLAAMVAAVVAVIMRLRSARGRARDQLRWFVYAGGILALLFIAQFVVRHVLGVTSVAFESLYWVLWGAAFLGLPLATGLAILRHSLFDIERLINRTLVYGVLTALLAAVYVAAVLASGEVLAALGASRESDLAVALSTLAVVAAFGPARRMLQRAVDRRFYRDRYDARLAIDRLAQRLRAEVVPEALRDDVVMSVQAALQPRSVSLWTPAATTSSVADAAAGSEGARS